VSTIIAGIRTTEQVELNTTGLFQLYKQDMELIEHLGANKFVEVMILIQQQG
jgi:hypothetical protein